MSDNRTFLVIVSDNLTSLTTLFKNPYMKKFWAGIAQPVLRFSVAERSEDRIPGSSLALGPTQPFTELVPGLFPCGKAAGAWPWSLNPI